MASDFIIASPLQRILTTTYSKDWIIRKYPCLMHFHVYVSILSASTITLISYCLIL